MNPGFSPAVGGYNPYSISSFLPGGFSQFTLTGIPGMTGGFAHPPGSPMARMMDGLNNQVAGATQGPYGGSVVSWAQSLLASQRARKQQGSSAPPITSQQGAPTSGSGFELIGLLLGVLLTAVSEKVKAEQEEEEAPSGQSE